MKLYKDEDGNIFAYELDGSQDDLIGDKIPTTQEEVDAINNARNAVIEAELQAQVSAKQSAMAKLAKLGLTEDEIKALVV
jgi:hypothetical protein